MRNICELLQIQYPILQGGMANIANHTLAAAVSNAGGLGVIASGGDDEKTVRLKIRQCKELTSRPFGVNIMMMSPHAKAIAEMVIEEGVAVVTTGAGNPGAYIPAWKAAGIKVIPVVPSVALAVRMERAGADAVVAEGQESGGHIGELTTMAMIPQIVDAVKIPVIAAGGIADFRQVLAAFALGAKGVQCGTVFLASDEAPIHANYKQIILDAKDIDTIVTGRRTGAPVRVLKTPMAREYNRLSDSGVTLEELETMTIGSLRKAVIDGDLEHGSFMAGQVAGLIKTIRPVKQIIADLFDPIKAYLDRLEVME
jgi:enoyl-[acyl-carrier protein] reductase II